MKYATRLHDERPIHRRNLRQELKNFQQELHDDIAFLAMNKKSIIPATASALKRKLKPLKTPKCQPPKQLFKLPVNRKDYTNSNTEKQISSKMEEEAMKGLSKLLHILWAHTVPTASLPNKNNNILAVPTLSKIPTCEVGTDCEMLIRSESHADKLPLEESHCLTTSNSAISVGKTAETRGENNEQATDSSVPAEEKVRKPISGYRKGLTHIIIACSIHIVKTKEKERREKEETACGIAESVVKKSLNTGVVSDEENRVQVPNLECSAKGRME